MTRVTHMKIEITKNPLLKVPVEVPQWEAHVILALWGDDANITGTRVINRAVPAANDEFTRLANKYGPRDEDIPYVARVYGSFGPGLRSLEREFNASVAGSSTRSAIEAVRTEPVDVVAPAQLAGFDGSKAPKAPEAEGEIKLAEPFEKTPEGGLTDAEIDAIDKVPALSGNTVGGVPVKEFLAVDAVAEAAAADAAANTEARERVLATSSDIADLTGEDDKAT